ncbi:MAG: ATP-binding protein [Pseudomonadota bacterium]
MNLGRQFGVQALMRALLLVGAIVTLSFVLFRTEFILTPIVVTALCVGLLIEFVFFVQRTNREVTRFFDSIRYADFSHRIDPALHGAGFEDMARSMRDVVSRLQDLRRTGEEDRLQLRAIVDHVPVPMFGLVDRERIVLHNHAARRFFAAYPVHTVDDLERYGREFTQAVRQQSPGERRVISLSSDGATTLRMMLSLTEIVVGQTHQRLVTLQNISDELAASELEAWQQMAQVLAHEIMNSLTPVSSLADTARTLLSSGDHDDRNKAQDAINTVAQRADALMDFVQSYRQFSRLPEPQKAAVDLEPLFGHAVAFTADDMRAAGIETFQSVTPASLQVHADRNQLEQVLINLLRNARSALRDTAQPQIRMVARTNSNGRTVIEVSDNGPGIREADRERVFVPYFSTTPGGSGVGLALTRQVMLGHGGTASVGASDTGGARVTLVF